MEIGVKTVNLDRIFDIVAGSAVTIVIGVGTAARGTSVDCWQGVATQDVCGVAFRAQVALLRCES